MEIKEILDKHREQSEKLRKRMDNYRRRKEAGILEVNSDNTFMARFKWWRRSYMRKNGGFWIRAETVGDLPFFPLFPWRWVHPEEEHSSSEFKQDGIMVEDLP